MYLCRNFDRIEVMRKKKLIVMVAYGGVGEFLFQLDLAKRFESLGEEVLFLVKSKYALFFDIASETDLVTTRFIDAHGLRYFAYMFYIWGLALVRKVTIVNSFNSLFYRLPTKIFYGVAKLCSARVVISKHTKMSSWLFEDVPYHDKEMIWQRNCRLVEHVLKKKGDTSFPIVKFKDYRNEKGGYIHIHPVGSSAQKSYPQLKLIEILSHLLRANHTIVLTMTPSEEKWYVTPLLSNFIATHKDNLHFKSKYFSAKEIVEYIQNAKVFCTVNTGLLWLSILLGKKVVVLDTFTDYEWTPTPYNGVTRLGHDYDENGDSLHLTLKKHEDGTYFESMYLIQSGEAAEAILSTI